MDGDVVNVSRSFSAHVHEAWASILGTSAE
jgi:hypothetical protein